MTATAMWLPSDKEIERSRLLAFGAQVGCESRSELDLLAREDPGRFWESAWNSLELGWSSHPTAVMERDAHQVHWFPGGRFNIASAAVDSWIARGRGRETAVRWETEGGLQGQLSYSELEQEVLRVAAGLHQLGVAVGDRVGLQLPMVTEALVAQLACAHLGAILVPVFSAFGADAVAARLSRARVSVHIIASGYERRGQLVETRQVAAEMARGTATLRRVVVVDLVASPPAAPRLPGEVSWESLGAAHEAPPVADVEAMHPLMIAFTSGTSGPPKGTVLTHAGFAVKAGTDAAWCFDVGPGDVAAWITDPGWIMCPITLIGGLVSGGSVAICDGAVDYPDDARLWRFADAAEVTMLGVSPTLVRTLRRRRGERADVGRPQALRVLASSGEPLQPDVHAWLSRHLGGGELPVINYSGGTEVSGAILSNTTAEPILPGAFAGPVPGMGADVVDDAGHSLRGAVGELVLTIPSPGMASGFWEAQETYYETYWGRWPGLWAHGDWAAVDEDGRWRILGRSDDTLSIAGKRVGPAEVEAAADGHQDVLVCAAIGVPDPVKGERLLVFVQRSVDGDGDAADLDELRAEVSARVTRALGPAIKPAGVLFVDDLPRTHSGKVMRRLVRAKHLGLALGDTSALVNTRALDAVAMAR